jgi:hypothetical protein
LGQWFETPRNQAEGCDDGGQQGGLSIDWSTQRKVFIS